MSMNLHKDIDLQGAIPDTPMMCREAVRHAVSTYQEKKKGRMSYQVILAAALLTLLLGGTAVALVNHFSVREYVALEKGGTAFEEKIVPLGQEVTSNGLTISLGDAVFDGRSLSLTMGMRAENGAEPLYVLPMLEAFSGGTQLQVDDYNALGFDCEWGFLYPDAGAEDRYGLTAELREVPSKQNVIWRYTLHVFLPTGEAIEAMKNGSRNAEMELSARSLGDYLSALGVGGEKWMFPDMIEETGLFTKADTIVFEFTIPVPERSSVCPESIYGFDGYEVAVKSVSVSFLQIEYELAISFDEPYTGLEEELPYLYELTDQEGTVLQSLHSGLSLSDDRMSCKVSGSVRRIAETPLTELTFTHKCADAEDGKADAFTVDIAQ